MSMEEIDILKGRIRDLSSRAIRDSYLTHTDFLSMSEQAMFQKILKEEHVSLLEGKYAGVEYLLYGGHSEDDRKIIFFLPYYLSREELLSQEMEGQTIACIHVYPRNRKFSDRLTHRDFLGAMMHLGVKREMYGDILTDGTDGYLFVMASIADVIQEELTKVRHTSVFCDIIKPKDCPFQMKFRIEDINVSSNRLDCVLAETYHLSRRDAQILVSSESVFINGLLCMDQSHTMKENERVSIKGKGKFLFLREKGLSRKGRIFVTIKRYC
jgi:RNA-binding protein YlmH